MYAWLWPVLTLVLYFWAGEMTWRDMVARALDPSDPGQVTFVQGVADRDPAALLLKAFFLAFWPLFLALGALRWGSR